MISRSRLRLGSIEGIFDTSATDDILSGIDKVEIRLHVLDQAHKASSFLKTPLRRVDLKDRNGELQLDIYGEQSEVLRGIPFKLPHTLIRDLKNENPYWIGMLTGYPVV